MNTTHLPVGARVGHHDAGHAPPERLLGIRLADEFAGAVQRLVAVRWRAAERARGAGPSDARVEARVARRLRRLLVEAQHAEQIRADVPVDSLIGSLQRCSRDTPRLARSPDLRHRTRTWSPGSSSRPWGIAPPAAPPSPPARTPSLGSACAGWRAGQREIEVLTELSARCHPGAPHAPRSDGPNPPREHSATYCSGSPNPRMLGATDLVTPVVLLVTEQR
jgi:hypothetical protein